MAYEYTGGRDDIFRLVAPPECYRSLSPQASQLHRRGMISLDSWLLPSAIDPSRRRQVSYTGGGYL